MILLPENALCWFSQQSVSFDTYVNCKYFKYRVIIEFSERVNKIRCMYMLFVWYIKNIQRIAVFYLYIDIPVYISIRFSKGVIHEIAICLVNYLFHGTMRAQYSNENRLYVHNKNVVVLLNLIRVWETNTHTHTHTEGNKHLPTSLKHRAFLLFTECERFVFVTLSNCFCRGNFSNGRTIVSTWIRCCNTPAGK